MLSNSVVSGGFALLLLFLTSMHVGSQHAMVLCVICGFASWGVNIGQDIESRAMAAAGMMAAVTSGAIAVLIVAGKVMLP